MKGGETYLHNLTDHWKIDVCIEIIETAANTITEFDLISSAVKNSIASGGTVKDCLRVLVAIGFVDYNSVRKEYKTTIRGERFAAVFDELCAAYPSSEEQGRIISLNRI